MGQYAILYRKQWQYGSTEICEMSANYVETSQTAYSFTEEEIACDKTNNCKLFILLGYYNKFYGRLNSLVHLWIKYVYPFIIFIVIQCTICFKISVFVHCYFHKT